MPAARSVFEVYADEYDLITNAAQRESYHRREVAAMIDRFAPETVLDAGCASGLTTQLFAERGVTAVGLDRSRPMIRVAKEKHAGSRLPMSFELGDFQRLPKRFAGKFDLVVCLANAIAGVPTVSALRQSLRSFRAVLAEGGHLVLQMLNYSAIEEGQLLPIKATRNGDIVYERLSERRGRRLSIIVTRADFGQTPIKYEVFRSQFDNYEVNTVVDAARRVGFKPVRKFRDLYFQKRFNKKARDLVLVCRR